MLSLIGAVTLTDESAVQFHNADSSNVSVIAKADQINPAEMKATTLDMREMLLTGEPTSEHRDKLKALQYEKKVKDAGKDAAQKLLDKNPSLDNLKSLKQARQEAKDATDALNAF